jgi:hypothetical protein
LVEVALVFVRLFIVLEEEIRLLIVPFVAVKLRTIVFTAFKREAKNPVVVALVAVKFEITISTVKSTKTLLQIDW